MLTHCLAVGVSRGKLEQWYHYIVRLKLHLLWQGCTTVWNKSPAFCYKELSINELFRNGEQKNRWDRKEVLKIWHGICLFLEHTAALCLSRASKQPFSFPLTGTTIWRRSDTDCIRWSGRTVRHLVAVKSLFCCVLQILVPQTRQLKEKESSYTNLKTNLRCLEDSPQRSASGLTDPGDNGSQGSGLDHWCRPRQKTNKEKQ